MSVLDVLTPGQMVQMMLDHSAAMDDAQSKLRDALHFEAACEQEYRTLKRAAWSRCPKEGPAKRQEAWVDGEVAEARRQRDDAVAESKAWMEYVRNKRQSLSALQSAANSIREEAAFNRTGPDLGA